MLRGILKRKKKKTITSKERVEIRTINERKAVKFGSVVLKVGKDVVRGTETSIDQLFSVDEQKKKFEVLENVTRDKTRINVTLGNVGSFHTIADATVKKGKKADGFMLLKRREGLSKNIVAAMDLKRGNKLEVTFELIQEQQETKEV